MVPPDIPGRPEIVSSIPFSVSDAHLRSLGYDLVDEYVRIILAAGFDQSFPVLEMASGPGRASAVLTRLGYRTITGDITRRKLPDLMNRVTGDFAHLLTVCALDMSRLPIRSASIRSLLCVNTVHELNEPETCLRELFRVVHPEGTLVISDFNDTGLGVMDQVHTAVHGELHDRGSARLSELVHLIIPSFQSVREFSTPLNHTWLCSGRAPSRPR